MLAIVVAGSSAWQLPTPMGRLPVDCARQTRLSTAQAVYMQTPATEEDTEEKKAPAKYRNELLPTNLIEGSEAPKDFVSQLPVQEPVALPAWAEQGPVFRRAEFWDSRTATTMEVLNVLGRFEKASQWGERTFFVTVPKGVEKKEVEDNSWTKQRFEMAQRMNVVERAALIQRLAFDKAETLPFTNEKLAASVGRTVDDFNSLPVSRAAVEVVYDALAESRASLIPPDKIDERRAGMINEDGSFNEIAFRAGLYKSRGIVIASWFMFGKGNFVWILVFVQFLHDARPDLFPTPKDLDLFKVFAVL